MSLRRRLSSGFGATAYGRAVSLLGQLAMVPVLLHSWGAATYGAWLTLTSLAAYLSQTSLGLIPAARSDMAMAYGRDDRSGVLETFQTALLFIFLSSTLGGLAFVAVILNTPVLSGLTVLPISHGAALLIMEVLTLQIVVSLQSGVIYGGLSALGHYGFAHALDATRQLADLLAVAVLVLVFRAPPEVAVLAYAVTSVSAMAVGLWVLRRAAPWLRVGARHASWSVLQRLWRPMLGGLALSFGYSGLVVQAPRLILAATSGPVSVAVFSLAAMLLRMIRMVQEMVVFPVGIEMARAFGTGDFPLAKRLLLVTSSLSFWMFLIAGPMIVLAGPWFIHLWTAGAVTPSRSLIALLVVAGLLSSLSMPAQQALLSINRLIAASVSLVLVSIPTLLLSFVLSQSFGAVGMAVGLCLLEGAFLVALIFRVSRWFDLSLVEYARAHAAPPIGMLWAEVSRVFRRLSPRGET